MPPSTWWFEPAAAPQPGMRLRARLRLRRQPACHLGSPALRYAVLAIRFHYRPVRYLLTRWIGAGRASFPVSPLGCISLDDIEPPALPGPDWVRIESTLSGICGSDLAALTAHDSFTLEPFGAFPFTFGHENVGRIAECGVAVAGWSVGDRVIVNPMLACLQRGLSPACDACARGEYGLCRRTMEGDAGGGPMIGYCPRTGGGWSRFFVAHVSQLHPMRGLTDEVGVLADPLASALRPVLLHPPADGDTVLVIGAGTIGVLTVRALRAIGWTGPLTVLGRYGFQAELGARAGADTALRDRNSLYEWAASGPGARAYDPSLAPKFVEGGPSLIFDTVGSERTVRDSMALCREGGKVVLVGNAARIRADWTRVWYRQLTLAGIFAYGLAPWKGRDIDIYEAALDLLVADSIGDLGMVTHTFALEEYRAAFAAALDKGGQRSIKVVLRPGNG
jgi:threonine dehydrogenase-like Zn-dependent dehydrogenase